MAYGDCPHDENLKIAWDAFCDHLKAAGMKAFKTDNPANPLQRADAFRFLTQNLGQAFDLALETSDTQYPALHAFCSPTRKLGCDCADFVYLQAWIDGQSTYRISGTRGDAPFLNFTVQGARPEQLPDGSVPLHEPFGDIPEANLFGHQLQTDSAGHFELFIGGEPRSSNWLPTTPESRKLFIRQGFDSWDQQPADMTIERIGMSTARPMPTPEKMVESMYWAGNFVTGLMTDWPEWAFENGVADLAEINAFSSELNSANDRKRGRAYCNMHWHLKPDEALVIEFDVHQGLWMLTNMGVFFTSMDYLYRPTSYTPGRTKVDRDGRIRIILSHDDPGYHNWLDTQGFERGNLAYRHMLEGSPAVLHTQVVKRDSIADVLSATSASITASERADQLRARFHGIKRRYRI